jgi:hypothetical protein
LRPSQNKLNLLAGASALVLAAAGIMDIRSATPAPALNTATAFIRGTPSPTPVSEADLARPGMHSIAALTHGALSEIIGSVQQQSQPKALESAFHSYFAYKSAHPETVHNPYLYFVDYGLSSTTPRGYLFDMTARRVVEGPFMVAHGRGSAAGKNTVPTRFSNDANSHATSLGLYVTQAVYGFQGHAGGRVYNSVGLRLAGVSQGFNDNAFARGVVAHGAPYVTPLKSGRSEGCPAMEPARAARILPEIADGGMVFLYAPDQSWLQRDPWVTNAAD